jgi:hypothetical protein
LCPKKKEVDEQQKKREERQKERKEEKQTRRAGSSSEGDVDYSKNNKKEFSFRGKVLLSEWFDWASSKSNYATQTASLYQRKLKQIIRFWEDDVEEFKGDALRHMYEN